MLIKIISLALLSALFLMQSCKELEEIPDFQEDFAGTYVGLLTYYHITGSTPEGYILSQVDTLSTDKEFQFIKNADSAVAIYLDDQLLFIGQHVDDGYFECLDCAGPPNYAHFQDADSVVVFLKIGVTNSQHFYGKRKP